MGLKSLLVLTVLSVACAAKARAPEPLVVSRAVFTSKPINLEWDPNAESEQIRGYKVYVGRTPSLYTDIFDVLGMTKWTHVNPDPGVRFYYAVSAWNFNEKGEPVEGPRSNEVSAVGVALEDPCAADATGHRAVQVAVGTWSRSVSTGNVGQVGYSLLLSRHPVTLVIVKLNGVEQDRLEGGDLRKVAGSYFQAPTTRGSYQLSVEARDASGCTDGADRPMTVTVK